MANWKRVNDLDDLYNETVLLRETYPIHGNVSYYAGKVDKTGYGYCIYCSNGKVMLSEEYAYHYILIDEILF